MRIKILLILVLGCSLSVISQEKEIKEADSLYSFGKRNQAIKLLDELEPKTEKINLKLAHFYKNSGLVEESLHYYETVLKQNSERVLTAIDYGELLLESKKWKEADSLFSKLSEKYPENASLTYRLALAREEQKDSTAMDLYFKTVGLDSTHQGALYKTAKYELQGRNHHNAIHLSKTGLRTRPDNASLLSILGQAYLVSLQFKEATLPFEKLLKLGETSEFVLSRLATAYRKSGETNNAIDTYLKLLNINNSDIQAYTNLGALYLKKNEVDKATEMFMMALFIKNQPVDNEYVNLGLSFKRKEDFKKAFASFEKALEENPKNERALIELAIAADAHLDDKEKVLEHYQNFVDKYSQSGRKDMLSIAEYRISELKKEMHLAK